MSIRAVSFSEKYDLKIQDCIYFYAICPTQIIFYLFIVVHRVILFIKQIILHLMR